MKRISWIAMLMSFSLVMLGCGGNGASDGNGKKNKDSNPIDIDAPPIPGVGGEDGKSNDSDVDAAKSDGAKSDLDKSDGKKSDASAKQDGTLPLEAPKNANTSKNDSSD